MLIRPRRLRDNPVIRNLVHETHLSLEHLIQPYFLTKDPRGQEPIQGFTGVFRWGMEALKKQINKDLENGLKSFLLFGASDEGLLPEAISSLKKNFGDGLLLFSDICLCPYTDHGHCGVVNEGRVDNDLSLEPLAKMALAHAQAGVDFVAPSDMMDGRIAAIRKQLDEKGFSQTGILAYSAKYASSYYGPFREALGSSPKATDFPRLKDRSTYQMDFRNTQEALRELKLDLDEGADLVMVKPALAYLDIIKSFRAESTVPVVAYSVSAEFEMVKALVAKGMADEKSMVLENLTAIRRAGAQMVITYFATELAEKGWL
ncbi:porphobilinogen synthase [bacterium]|nr:porphobilinogen synthase [bacterium]